MDRLALRAGAWSWAFATLIGQWVFVYFVVAMYGTSTVSGDFEHWNKAHLVIGYVPGDTIGNIAFAAHVLLAAVVLAGGMLQLVPQIRERALGFHRWNGRVFLLTAVATSVDGLYMLWVRGATIELVNSVAVSGDAILVLAFASLAWRAALARDIDSHRRWALRAFMVANAVFFVRIFSTAWVVLTGGAGMTSRMDGPMNYVFELGSYLLPLAVLELYLRATTARTRLLAALTLLLATAYMIIGTVEYMPHKLGLLTA